jgi:hypothetical protein
MNHCRETRVSFLVSRSDTAELFEFAEEIFNEMAPAVHVEVTFDGLGPVGFRRDDDHGAAVVQFGAQPIHIEGFVGEQSFKVDALDQRCDTDTVVTLARHQDEARKIAQRIDQRQDFGRQAATRSTDGLILSPPFAPVPC